MLSDREAELAMVEIGGPLRGRDRLLALMDVGAMLCRPRDPQCDACPLISQCATRGPLPGEVKRRAKPYAGSFRERRGQVMAALRTGRVRANTLDAEALASLVDDGLAVVSSGWARLP